jgi:uncharacterized protein YaaN involved in tellurite resistance
MLQKGHIMQDLRTNKELTIKLNVEEMTPTQIRLIKNITSLLSSVLSSDEESEYFELSSELLKKTAEIIKHSDFANMNKNMSYGDQAVEFAVDFLNETLDQNKMNNIDN